jgi:uncharacterized protein with von Willebrand factor type A (vWA) domain
MTRAVVAVDMGLFERVRKEHTRAREVGSVVANYFAVSPSHDLVGTIVYGEQADVVSVDELHSAVGPPFYGSNLMAAIELGHRLLGRGQGRIVVVMASAPDAHNTADGGVWFNFPPSKETETATVKQITAAFDDNLSIDVLAIGPFDGPGLIASIGYLESAIEERGGRITSMTAEDCHRITHEYLVS